MRSSETLPFKSSRPVANEIHVIQPYRHASTWVFDDPSVGLHKEPFVSGIPQMIDTLIANVPSAEKGFRLLFSAEPFPGYQIELIKGRAEYQGVWYRWAERKAEGWLLSSAVSLLSDGTASVIRSGLNRSDNRRLFHFRFSDLSVT